MIILILLSIIASSTIGDLTNNLAPDDYLLDSALSTFKLVGPRRLEKIERKRGRDSLVNYIRTLNIWLEDEEKIEEEDSYSSWKLKENIKEKESQEVLEEYIQKLDSIKERIERLGREVTSLFNREEELTSLCSRISEMSSKEIGIFLRYCLSINSDNLVLKLRDLIARRIAVSDTKLLLEEEVLKKIKEWVYYEYDIGFYRCSCDNSFRYLPKIVHHQKNNFKIILTPEVVKLRIELEKDIFYNLDEVKNIIQHLNSKLGSDFPIQEIELYSINFDGIDHPLSIFKNDILKNVTRIIFNTCFLKDNTLGLDPEDKDVKNITSLKTIHCDLEGIEAPPELLENLEILEIKENYLPELPSVIFSMNNLRKLIIQQREPFLIPPELYQLTNLKILRIRNSSTPVSDIDQDSQTIFINAIDILRNMKGLEGLTIFNISVYLKENINFRHENLRYLIISGCELTELPSFIYRSADDRPCLPKLEVLDLSSNYIKGDILPNQISPIKKLNLSCNELTEVPKWVSNLKCSITVLDLSSNNIKSLAKELVSFNNLEVLKLNSNGCMLVSNLPSNLLELDLCYNNISTLPEKIWELKELRILDISRNNLEILSDRIVDLSELRKLNISHNKLVSLPEGLKKCRKLESININYNRIEIKELISWIRNSTSYFPNLQELNAVGNSRLILS